MADDKRRGTKAEPDQQAKKSADTSKAADKRSGYNKFILNEVYQDAAAVFAVAERLLSEIAPTAVVILDTNALLVPYSIGPKSFGDIQNAFERLKQQGRLVIPGQVAREFARNRGAKLAEVFHQLHERRRSHRSIVLASIHCWNRFPITLKPLRKKKKCCASRKSNPSFWAG